MRVTRPAASGSLPSGNGSVTMRLARGSAAALRVCSAIVDTKTIGRPASSRA